MGYSNVHHYLLYNIHTSHCYKFQTINTTCHYHVLLCLLNIHRHTFVCVYVWMCVCVCMRACVYVWVCVCGCGHKYVTVCVRVFTYKLWYEWHILHCDGFVNNRDISIRRTKLQAAFHTTYHRNNYCKIYTDFLCECMVSQHIVIALFICSWQTWIRLISSTDNVLLATTYFLTRHLPLVVQNKLLELHSVLIHVSHKGGVIQIGWFHSVPDIK